MIISIHIYPRYVPNGTAFPVHLLLLIRFQVLFFRKIIQFLD